MVILVVGGSGFIGSEVVKALSTNNVKTISYDLVNTSMLGPKQNWVRADILELQTLQRVFFEYDVDSVVHLIGLPAIDYCERNPHFSFLLNVVSVQSALEAMRLADIGKIVFASSATVYGDRSEHPMRETDPTSPANIYGRHKLMAEECIQSYVSAYGISATILRIFNVYGGDPDMGKEIISIFIRRALKGEPLQVRGPRKFRDFVHVGDVAEAFTRSVTHDDIRNVTLNIGSGTRTSLRQVASIVASHYPGVRIQESDASDDGTGLCGDVTRAREVMGFLAREPTKGIDAHVSKYSVPEPVRNVQ